MRIAQIAPLWETVPPKTYGGTELVVNLLTEELVRRGHQVTLFASGGTRTLANLVECTPKPLRLMEEEMKYDKTHCHVIGYEARMLGRVFSHADQFDVIHNHLGFNALPYGDLVRTPMVTTLHNTLEPQVVYDLFHDYSDGNYISISDYQRKLWPKMNYSATIYHGIDMKKFDACFEDKLTETRDKGYFVFLGRLSPEKGPDTAIDIAKALGRKLIMAGKIDRVDKVYFDREIAHRIDGEQIVYIGEVDHKQKVELLRNAAATLCPIRWPEPFGLVLIESMACGTPVFALRDGSIPEVIDHGKTGFIGKSKEELIEALRNLERFDRREVRRVSESRFTMERMVDDHLKLYESLVAKRKNNIVPVTSAPTVASKNLGLLQKQQPL